MDSVTTSIREMYEQFPYPSGLPTIRAATDVRLLLSYVEKHREVKQELHALDAGCGRGMGLIGCASLQPDVQFTGIDINRVALKEAQEQAVSRKLTNVNFQECDLMTLNGLNVPNNGFDVIYSSGVVHHLSDPLTGLRNLKDRLAPHGVISFMVYGKEGRAPLNRLNKAIKLITAPSESFQDRIPFAGALSRHGKNTVLAGSPWETTSDVDEIELVDRCLNVNETSFDIYSLWSLLEEAGMHFIRWIEPNDWTLPQIPDELVRLRMDKLSEVDRYHFVELMCWRHKLELIIAKKDTDRRSALSLTNIRNESFAVNPDVSFSMETRNLRNVSRIEKISFTVRTQKNLVVADPLLTKAILLLRDQNKPFSGDSWIKVVGDEGIDAQNAVNLIGELVKREIVFRPHAIDC